MATSEIDRLVVIGSSAGGIDALGELLSGLPADFAAPIVVAQHLDPRRPSHLPDILRRRTSLQVRAVSSREKLRTGSVYIVPSDTSVDVADGHVSLVGTDEQRPRPSVDRLFGSAASSYGEGLIAIVLTGAGSDGSEGARKVKLAGGTVIIQDPATAAYPSMPQSLAPTTVDIVATLEAIPAILVDLLAHPPLPADEENQALMRFLATVHERTGIDFTSYKRPTILRRLQRRMAAVRAGGLREYTRYAARNPAEYDRLASSFLIKVTEFFRDPELFDVLRQDLIPRLVKESAERKGEVRVWSAGCATGEEAYSLGILLAEALGDGLASHQVRVFATDVDNDAINFARRGVYSESALANVPPELVDRYFTRQGDDYEIANHIRAITVFGQHDLAQRAPFPRIDLAVSRNVLIYFATELQRRALQLFAFSLREGGYLVLGKAESISPAPEHFVLENARLKMYRRHGARILIPATRGLGATYDPEAMAAPRPPLRVHTDAALRRPLRDVRPTTAERAEQIVLRLPVGVIVMSTDYEIQLINTHAREVLGIHGTAVGQDFVHLARDVPSQALREGIGRAAHGEQASTTLEQSAGTTGQQRMLRLTFMPHRSERDDDRVDTVVVMVEDVSDAAAEVSALQSLLGKADEELAALRTQVAAQTETNRQLLDANRELTMANAELRSGNEELLVGSEEVQAATEEVETLNEELQATNEELETLNEELQATVEELNTTNDDLEARSVELEEAMAAQAEQRAASERERGRLSRLLVDHREGLIVIDSQGRLRLRSDTWAELGHDRTYAKADDPSTFLTLDELVEEMRPLAARAEATSIPVVAHGPRGTVVDYELRAEGLPDEDGKPRGGLIMLVRRGRRRARQGGA